MRAGVVGAEQQLPASSELDTQVGLGTAPVAAVDAVSGLLGATAVVITDLVPSLVSMLNVTRQTNQSLASGVH